MGFYNMVWENITWVQIILTYLILGNVFAISAWIINRDFAIEALNKQHGMLTCILSLIVLGITWPYWILASIAQTVGQFI